MKHLKLNVDGITCSGCAIDVASVLKDANGILNAEADYVKGTVAVDYHPDEIDEERILDLIRKLGLSKRG